MARPIKNLLCFLCGTPVLLSIVGSWRLRVPSLPAGGSHPQSGGKSNFHNFALRHLHLLLLFENRKPPGYIILDSLGIHIYMELGESCELEPLIKMALIMAICYWPKRAEANAHAHF